MFERYAIYYAADGDLAQRGAAWLGYDLAIGAPVAHPNFAGLDLHAATQRPRGYGFHATIKAPFRLSEESNEHALEAAFATFCASQKPAASDALRLSQIGRFLALTLEGDQSHIKDLAAQAVRAFDSFRAPLSEQEIARRKPERLSEAQRRNLMRWGYPHVMDEFQFHMTLTGPLKDNIREAVKTAAGTFFEPALPRPFVIDTLTLAGQNEQSNFEKILTLPLTG
ncbi:DUF1045 domain-containing protein [Planktotalea sp.]|uniref:DUF1045 domain-containing protein n=1 Tax=Planktotalea sp. TaxID=2029877 RepID=UPI00329765C3